MEQKTDMRFVFTTDPNINIIRVRARTQSDTWSEQQILHMMHSDSTKPP